MQERHFKRDKYFEEQTYTTEKYVIPFIGEDFFKRPNMSVLEIGSGEGGNMKPFLDRGFRVTGVELEEVKNEWANEFFASHPQRSNLTLICEDIYNFNLETKYDLIVIRDVVEHIHDQAKFMRFIQDLLKDGGRIFIAFPPWCNPFGGHQQVCENKILSMLPYYHILPKAVYKAILKLGKENLGRIDGLLEIKETGISIERFKHIVKTAGYKMDKEVFYFINPNYEVKFGLKPRAAWKIISAIPVLRNFLITSYYCVLSKK
jgi:SAM-dependent methyltransferase